MPRKQLALFAALSWTLSLTATAGQATGTVNTVAPNTMWDGTFVQLNVPITQGYEPQCPSANFAFIPASDPVYSSVVAALMAAKASGEIVTLYTSGCVTVAGMGTQPRIFSVDYGVRMPGT